MGRGQRSPPTSPRIQTGGSAHQGCSQGHGRSATRGGGACQAWVAGSATPRVLKPRAEPSAHRGGDEAAGRGSRKGLGWMQPPHRGRTPRHPLHPRAGVSVRAPQSPCCGSHRTVPVSTPDWRQQRSCLSSKDTGVAPASEILAETWPPSHRAAGCKFLSLTHEPRRNSHTPVKSKRQLWLSELELELELEVRVALNAHTADLRQGEKEQEVKKEAVKGEEGRQSGPAIACKLAGPHRGRGAVGRALPQSHPPHLQTHVSWPHARRGDGHT